MDAVNRQDVVFMENDFITLMQFMEPSLDERIVHDTHEKMFVPFRNLHPKILSPAS